MLNEDNLDDLRSAMFDYIDSYGLPTDRETLAWFQEVAREDTTPEQAFAPMYENYFSGSGGMFSVETWMEWTYNIENILFRPDEGGEVYFNFDFDFESDDGEYSGSRGAHTKG